jgi:hypothetical protein
MNEEQDVFFSANRSTRLDSRRRHATRWEGIVKICAAAFLLVLGLQSSTQASSVEPTVIAAYESLRQYITSLPTGMLQKGLANSLVMQLASSQKAYGRGESCAAAQIIQAYLNHARALRTGKGLPVAEDLYNRGWTLLSTLLTSLPPGEACADFLRFGAKPVTEIAASDNARFRATLSFGQPMLRTVTDGGEIFTEVSFPGLENDGRFGGPQDIGKPAVPMTFRLIAFPIGAQPTLAIVNRVSREFTGVNLYPCQPSAVDGRVSNAVQPTLAAYQPPFAKDAAAYQENRLFPQAPISIQVVGKIRDLNVAQVAVAPAQYNPATQTLVVNDQLDFEVQYANGTGAFVTAQSLNPFERFNITPVMDRALLLNQAELYEYVWPSGVRALAGEELLIITAPAFVGAANDLAQWKNEKGILTRVVQTGAGPERAGVTAAEIRGFVQYQYDNASVRPSYLLLLGDAEFIPPFYRSAYNGSKVTGTDLDYSLLAGDDLLADLGVARIPASSNAEAQAVVDKIIKYEKDPVSLADFYKRAALAGYFQCCGDDGAEPVTATFIRTLERIRDELVSEGYTADRLYQSDTEYNSSYTGDPTPRYYWDGTPLPADIGPGSGFSWDADGVDIINALNDGRFLLFHRDHGKPWGFKHPAFSSDDAQGLNNGERLPMLFSINCATAYFDSETVNAAIAAISDPVQRNEAAEEEATTYEGFAGESFIEVMLGLEGRGVVGAVGATRRSPSGVNSSLAQGLADALFPGLLPDYGGAAPITRLADILNYGRSYVYYKGGSPQPAPSLGWPYYNLSGDETILFHAFGDPTLEVWTARPWWLSRQSVVETDPWRLVVFYSEAGATITARQGGNPIGRAVVVDGKAELPYVVDPIPGQPIELSASKPGFVSAALVSCHPALENPVLASNGSEDFVGSDGTEFTRYLLTVTNRDLYPDDMFEPAPGLPPCGLNTDSSRSWVDIFDDLGQRRYGFCAFTSSEGLANLWFAVPKGASPPAGVYVEITDRQCGTTYRSNTVPIGQ